MSSESEFNLTELVPEFPNRPKKEISRDSFMRWIINEFGPECQKQIIASGPLTGKTNFLAQFARENENRAISYFINANPLTQDLRTFLYVICNQIYHLLGRPSLPENIGLEELKSTFPGLAISLADQAKKKDIQFYFVVDGLEWGASGEKGNRIIDYPLISFSRSPFILFSSRADRLDSLPVDDFVVRDNIGHFLEFNLSDTREVLSDLNLSSDDIRIIHQRAKGLPGYVRIIRDTIRNTGTGWISSIDLPNDLENLIKKQLKLIYENATPQIIQAIEITAVSPKPITINLLAGMLNTDDKELCETLNKTGIILYNKDKKTVQISPEYTKDTILSRIGNRRSKLTEDILNHANKAGEEDELLTALLLKEAKDYQGISGRLGIDKIITSFEKNSGTSLMRKQMHIASQLAYEDNNISGLIKWNLYLKATKSALHYTTDSKEISALIAVGDSETALRKAYNLSDALNKARLLARAYTKMKEKNERIPKNALEELKLILEGQSLDEYDKDILQELAMDLFPILPDYAVDILETKFSKEDQRNSIEVAVTESISSSRKKTENKLVEITYPQLAFYPRLSVNWLSEQTFEELRNNIIPLENIKAKEYMIRQWCTQNRDDPELHNGIQLWIDTVVGDSTYPISLRSLRKISNSLKSVKKEYQEKLLYKLEAPTFFSIRTPWEEWIGFHLNLAEVLYEHNKKLSKQRIDQIHETINLEINDQDIKVFCYARLWVTVSKYYKEIEQSVKLNFERVLSSLLHNAALHDEILNKTLQIITPIDIHYAIEKACEMNTSYRRQTVIRRILETSLSKSPSLDITDVLKKVLDQHDENEKHHLIFHLTQALERSKNRIGEENQSLLLKYARKIPDHLMRAEALSNLAAIWNNEKLIRTEKLVAEALTSWSQEDDLKLRISIGYDIVERISHNTKEGARQFLEKVQEIYLLPGAAVASGDLGSIYYYSLEIAIRSMTLREISNKDGALNQIYELINRLPSGRKRINLYGQLAARSYTLGYSKEAEDVIRVKLLPEVYKVGNQYDRFLTIQFCLPVIFKYHKQTAYELAKDLPESIRNNSWLFTTIWTITKGKLQTRDVDLEHFKAQSDYLTLKDFAYEAAKNICVDVDLFWAISAICRSIEQSIKSQKMDATQAHLLLQLLDELAREKLPDNRNIQHKGYLIISLATIHGARSVVYKSVSKKRNLSKVDIRKEWDELDYVCRSIPNLADRVFVMQYVAKEFFKHNEDRAKKLLEEADGIVDSIPAIIDRADRLEEIGKVWGLMGQKSLAQYTLDRMSKLVEQMNDFSQDRKLEALVQAAYEFSPDFADHIAARYDSRYPDQILSPLRIQNEIKKFTSNPERILKIYEDIDRNPQVHIALARSATNLYNELIFGHGRIPPNNVLLEWLRIGSQLDENAFFNIVQWVQECLNSQPASPGLTPIFVELASLILKIAMKVSPSRNEGIPEDIVNMLPGLSSKITVFRVGEFEKARNWLNKWLRDHAQNYIKVVDPYFGPEQIVCFTEVPKNCKVLIVTTDKYFKEFPSQESIKAKIEYVWRQYGKGNLLQMSLIIVPENQEELFHDRVIVSQDRGLDLGQSLNGLGNKIGKITDLSYEDAKELEAKYVDGMLNQNSWFLDHDVQPILVRVGP